MGLRYRRNGHVSSYNVPGTWCEEDNISDVAEAAANDFWCNHDGWEAKWPVRFEILRENGDLLDSREVAVDMEPVFSTKA